MVVWLLLRQFFFAPSFIFEDGKSFHGSKIHNPYQEVSANDWIKCNFHAHSSAWAGLTNGKGKPTDIARVYDSLKYSIHCVSNYNKIEKGSKRRKNYIPAYEHGYNIMKTHQLVLGSNKVLWLDYILPQTLSNKQDILNKLARDTNSLIILNHPDLRDGYTLDDLRSLSQYHCIEILNPWASSLTHWDAALSAGNFVSAVGDDDAHNVLKTGQAGRMCTFVNGKPEGRSVLRALKEGKSFAMQLGTNQNLDSLPRLESLVLKGDTIVLQMDRPAKEISFTGQEGRLLKSVYGNKEARYVLKKADHYARASVYYDNGTRLFFNPVFFTEPGNSTASQAFINGPKTFISKAVGILLAIAWIHIVYLVFYRKKTAGAPAVDRVSGGASGLEVS